MTDIVWVRKVQKIGDSIGITIPEEIATSLKIKPKDKMIITVEGKRIVIVK